MGTIYEGKELGIKDDDEADDLAGGIKLRIKNVYHSCVS
jgi:hypothetical protein